MAVTILQDKSTGDLALTNNKLVLTSSKQEVSYHQVVQRLNMFRGTWYRNINFGIPWLKNDNNPIQLLGNTPKSVIDGYLQEIVLGAEFITGIEQGSYVSTVNKATRVMTVSFTAETESGPIEINEELNLL